MALTKCTWCNKVIDLDKETYKTLEDTINRKHYFHPDCHANYIRFMRVRP